MLDGSGTGVLFNGPAGVTVDRNNNIYIADFFNNAIRKATLAGAVTILAGSGSGGANDGTGAAASFFGPLGVAVDLSGNVYVADCINNLIRTITPGGVVSTLAGSGQASFTDGPGISAEFNGPRGIAVDSNGVIYVADTGNHRIRKITLGNMVTTLAGDGTAGFTDGSGTGAQLASPQGVTADASGNLYIADTGNHSIRKITAAGVVTTLVGNGTAGFSDGTGTGAQFNTPYGIAVDMNGDIYVVDGLNHRIRKVTTLGVVTSVAGSGAPGFIDGTGTAAQFNTPFGIGIDSNNNFYIGDPNNHRIRKIQ